MPSTCKMPLTRTDTTRTKAVLCPQPSYANPPKGKHGCWWHVIGKHNAEGAQARIRRKVNSLATPAPPERRGSDGRVLRTAYDR